MDALAAFTRHDQPGYHALADLPQRPPVTSIAKGSGWYELDQIFKIYPGQFVMVTGKAGHGKSTLLLNLICNWYCEHALKSFLYVPENEDYIRDTLSGIWGDRQNWDAFAHTGCFVQSSLPEAYDSVAKTLDWVLNQAVVSVVEDGAKVIVCDPWNELERAKPRDMTLTDYIGMVIQWVKQFARKYSVTFILVAHPTKAGVAEGKVPGGYDIEGSAHWMNKVDNLLVVERDPTKPVCQVISAKVRERGAGKRGGVCFFDVDEATGIFKPQYGAVSL